MKKSVLIIGSGGREHALGWKLSQSLFVGDIYFAPGNAGTAQIGTNVPIDVTDVDTLCQFAEEHSIDLTVVGPEASLEQGIVDVFQSKGLQIFGPTEDAARLETSKAWTAQFLERHSIPHPQSIIFSDIISARRFFEENAADVSHYVIKADGLCLGKGVFLPESLEEAISILKKLMVDRELGNAGSRIVVQERLEGYEVSVLSFSDGTTVIPMVPAQDYKRLLENNEGPMTGGVGAVCPSPEGIDALIEDVTQKILIPTVRNMKEQGQPFVGVLYAGLMITQQGPQVLEYNVRFGDPETEVLMMLLESDLYGILSACVMGTLSELSISYSSEYAVTVILTSEGYPGQYKKHIPIQIQNSSSVRLFHAGTTLLQNQIVTNGGRVIAVTSKGTSIHQARKNIYSSLNAREVYFDGMQFRTDIGGEKITDTEIKPSVTSTPQTDTVIRIEISSSVPDMRSAVRRDKIKNLLQKTMEIHIDDVYTVTTQLSNGEIQRIASLVANPVTQHFRVSTVDDPHLTSLPFSWAIEVGFLPGVTDNIGTTAKEMMGDHLGGDIGTVYSSQITYLSGGITENEVRTIADSLYNPLIQRVNILTYDQYHRQNGMGFTVPHVHLSKQPKIEQIDLHISDEELLILGKQGIRNADGTRRGPLALDLLYLSSIRSYFDRKGRNPTDIELESIAQTWSEHCKHTIFRDSIDTVTDGLYQTYIKRATEQVRKARGDNDICVSVFSDNSGAIIFNDEYLITDKVETHNSPSALDPFGGAITGIVGVNRDTLGFGLGAKPVLNRFGFCLAPPDSAAVYFRDQERKEPLLSSRRILDGVVAGVNSGGNCSGIPTPLGFLYFDERYRGKPLVFAGTVGLIPRKIHGIQLHQKQANPGDYIVMIGGRVGVDGIHGATFSSEALSSGSPATAVQIGDPITQKKLSDALIKEARDQGLYTSITDNGAGGLSCSVAEMAKESGGCLVILDDIPLKYPGLEPWQIWISESQERMTVAVPPSKWAAFAELMNRRGVEATIIGTFTQSGKCIVTYDGKTIMDIDMEFLHNGLPNRSLQTTWNPPPVLPLSIPVKTNISEDFLGILRRLNIGSIETISMQYDHEVQGTSVIKPLQGKGRVNGDAAVIQPVLSETKGIVVSYGLYPSYSDQDPYAMTAASIDTAIRNAITVGGSRRHLAILDNFCWCNPTDPSRLGQLKLAAQALHDYAIAFNVPIISGKDSMHNDFKGFDEYGKNVHISIPPTLLISSLGVVQDVSKTVSIDAKFPEDIVYILGETYEELNATEYDAWLQEESNIQIGGAVPTVHAELNIALYDAYETCVEQELIRTAVSIGRGGLAAAVGKMTVAGDLGVTLSLQNIGSVLSDIALLFSETQGRILVVVAPEKQDVFEQIMKKIPHYNLGSITREKRIEILGMNGRSVVSTRLKDAVSAYKSTFGIRGDAKPQAAVITGYGINCEEETGYAFERAGAEYTIVHINDFIDRRISLTDFKILAVPGGFAFGDDTGSGNAFAQKMKNHLWNDIVRFIEDDHLVIGICNGFQVLVNLGLLPAVDKRYGEREVALLHNDTAVYTDRWVDLHVRSTSPWMRDISELSLPIAHGEGKFYATPHMLETLQAKHLIAAAYTQGEVCNFQSLPANPNGSVENIAAITDETGRILGMMPHPERAIFFTHLPHWTYLKQQYHREGRAIPSDGPGLKIFQNAVTYFS